MSDVIPPDEQYYSTKKVAELFDVSIETVGNWIKRGLIEGRKINGYWRVKRSSVHEFANARHGR